MKKIISKMIDSVGVGGGSDVGVIRKHKKRIK